MNEKIFVSDEWELGCRGHENFEFIDVALNDDNQLFIDPCLIENWNSDWARTAISTIESFFIEFYRAYRNNEILLKNSLLSHGREQNATRLGYGDGDNGKGNTLEGLLEIFRPLEILVNEINTIGTTQDLTIFTPGFAEDGLSDLLTNIIHKELNDFTVTQMEIYGVQPNSTTKFHTWDAEERCWTMIESPCYRYEKNEILLVPKRIIRNRYLFNVGQYFGRIILERERAKDLWQNDTDKPISKKEIEKQLRTDEEHWKYKYVIEYSTRHNDALEEYHKKLPSFYAEYGQPLEDIKLDEIIYQEIS